MTAGNSLPIGRYGAAAEIVAVVSMPGRGVEQRGVGGVAAHDHLAGAEVEALAVDDRRAAVRVDHDLLEEVVRERVERGHAAAAGDDDGELAVEADLGEDADVDDALVDPGPMPGQVTEGCGTSLRSVC